MNIIRRIFAREIGRRRFGWSHNLLKLCAQNWYMLNAHNWESAFDFNNDANKIKIKFLQSQIYLLDVKNLCFISSIEQNCRWKISYSQLLILLLLIFFDNFPIVNFLHFSSDDSGFMHCFWQPFQNSINFTHFFRFKIWIHLKPQYWKQIPH